MGVRVGGGGGDVHQPSVYVAISSKRSVARAACLYNQIKNNAHQSAVMLLNIIFTAAKRLQARSEYETNGPHLVCLISKNKPDLMLLIRKNKRDLMLRKIHLSPASARALAAAVGVDAPFAGAAEVRPTASAVESACRNTEMPGIYRKNGV